MRRRDISKALFATAAGPAFVARPADTQTCTAPCFAQTPAEMAASVTPVNYVYTGTPQIDPRRYGMKADGMTDDSIAFQNAMNVAARSGGYVQLPAGQILVGPSLGTSLVIPNYVRVAGCGPQNTKVLRGFTGNLVEGMGAYASLMDLTLEGQQATYGAGVGIDVTAGFNQHWRNVEINDFASPCVRFAANAGANSSMVGGSCFTTAAPGTAAAIQINGTDSAAVPRVFLGVESGGCTLFDFGGCNDLFISGGYSNGLIFGAASSKVYIANFRIGAAAGAITIDGSAHQITNTVIAASLTIQGNDHNINIEPSVGWDSITDSSTGSAVFIKQVGYTPTLTNVTLGNGTVVGQWFRVGNYATVDVVLTLGSTSNVTGTIQIGLPLAPYSFGQFVVGNALLQHGGAFQVAAVVSNPAVSYVTLAPHGASGFSNATIPWAWANGDYIQLHVEYPLP